MYLQLEVLNIICLTEKNGDFLCWKLLRFATSVYTIKICTKDI
jgi:hypothetical protein